MCSYRCIVTYESEILEKFSLCILQKHNCLNNYAEVPVMPNPEPLKIFRKEPLTKEMAENIFIGFLGKEKWSWRVASGKNPAYDYFPCQFQLYYRGRAKGSIWYDPIFKVTKFDGNEIWRSRHYRVRQTKTPGFVFLIIKYYY